MCTCWVMGTVSLLRFVERMLKIIKNTALIFSSFSLHNQLSRVPLYSNQFTSLHGFLIMLPHHVPNLKGRKILIKGIAVCLFIYYFFIRNGERFRFLSQKTPSSLKKPGFYFTCQRHKLHNIYQRIGLHVTYEIQM